MAPQLFRSRGLPYHYPIIPLSIHEILSNDSGLAALQGSIRASSAALQQVETENAIGTPMTRTRYNTETLNFTNILNISAF